MIIDKKMATQCQKNPVFFTAIGCLPKPGNKIEKYAER
jgi:hypothetical protein